MKQISGVNNKAVILVRDSENFIKNVANLVVTTEGPEGETKGSEKSVLPLFFLCRQSKIPSHEF